MRYLPAGRLRVAVIGIGNSGRGDDAVGRAVAARLRRTMHLDVTVAEADGEATELLGLLDGVDRVFMIDACLSGAPAGTVHRFDIAAGEMPLPASPISSHGMGLAEALELARALDQLPPHCIVYAVEGLSFETGADLSAPVVAAAHRVVDCLKAELADCECLSGKLVSLESRLDSEKAGCRGLADARSRAPRWDARARRRAFRRALR
ncbi:MAG: hydrogenase maturation protease [Acetobacteraceae bacterium]|nr:hydrogenase maturation protease [Acetobacteraceae bacterium]